MLLFLFFFFSSTMLNERHQAASVFCVGGEKKKLKVKTDVGDYVR